MKTQDISRPRRWLCGLALAMPQRVYICSKLNEFADVASLQGRWVVTSLWIIGSTWPIRSSRGTGEWLHESCFRSLRAAAAVVWFVPLDPKATDMSASAFRWRLVGESHATWMTVTGMTGWQAHVWWSCHKLSIPCLGTMIRDTLGANA